MLRRTWLLLLLAAWLSAPGKADTVVNWENGFEVQVPTIWLRWEGGAAGMKLALDDVQLEIVPFAGITQAAQIERLHRQSKESGYQFKTERSLVIQEVPGHEMIYFRQGKYLIYYVLMAGQRGFLLTLRSESTDSPAFLEAQEMITRFRVLPNR